MASRVFLHVGTPKSGTTFLQSVWWANKPALRKQGLLLPGKGVNRHFWASCVVRGLEQFQHLPPAAAGAWTKMLGYVAEFERDALISHELFSPADADRAASAIRELGEVADEVHVILTARDLARQIPADWQQRTKHGRAQPFNDFVEELRNDPSMNFWRSQDVAAVLDRWSQGVPPERVHLVVLPPPGSPPSFLWDQMCVITGVDGTGMPELARRRNESLGLAEAETMRRISAELNRSGMTKSTERLMKGWFVENIMRSSDPERIVVPASAYPWVVERAQRMVDELSPRGYHVAGDLVDLVPSPQPTPGRGFGDLTEGEVAAAAVSALARVVQYEERSRAEASGLPRPTMPDLEKPPPEPAPRGLLSRLLARR